MGKFAELALELHERVALEGRGGSPGKGQGGFDTQDNLRDTCKNSPGVDLAGFGVGLGGPGIPFCYPPISCIGSQLTPPTITLISRGRRCLENKRMEQGLAQRQAVEKEPVALLSQAALDHQGFALSWREREAVGWTCPGNPRTLWEEARLPHATGDGGVSPLMRI